MRDTLMTAGVLLLLADVVWANTRLIREQNRADRAEADLWADLAGTRGTPIPLARPEPLALGQTTAPTQAELHLWLLSTDGAPIGRHGRQGQGKPIPDWWNAVSAWGESITAPGRRVLPKWWRYSTGELQAAVG